MFLFLWKLGFYFLDFPVFQQKSNLNMKNYLIFAIIVVELGHSVNFCDVLDTIFESKFGTDLRADPLKMKKSSRSRFSPHN